jgi:hypothetical protein
MRVRLKRGQSKLSAQQKNAIHRLEQQRGGRKPLRVSDKCTIFFARGKAVQRCEGRKAMGTWKRVGKANARKACRRGGTGWKRKTKAQARAGRKPTAQLFTRC